MNKGCLTGLIVALVLIFVLAIPLMYYVSAHNRIVTLQEEVNSKWGQVENVLQRRADLIPNLVATVKGYATHENEVFTAIANARSRLAGAGTPDEKARAAGDFEGALSRLLVVVENYPQLKADQNFLRLQDELAGTENRLTVERMRYNETVKTYNASIRRFPASFVAGLMNADPRAYFESAPAAKEAPKVDFSTP